jgi:dihydroflavonol-4-reductase
VDEGALATLEEMTNPYKRSKWLAEEVARQLATRGLPIVIVNPTAPVGPRDVKPTPTGQVIVDFLNRAMPAFLDTGLNWVHVRDVAAGHLLAAERGRVGERYILGHEQGNWTLQEALQVLSEVTGLPAPRWRIPYAVAYLFACLDEARSRWTLRPPRAPLAGVRMARYKMFFTPAKAVRELGLPQTAPREAMAEAVSWFRGQGMVRTR